MSVTKVKTNMLEDAASIVVATDALAVDVPSPLPTEVSVKQSGAWKRWTFTNFINYLKTVFPSLVGNNTMSNDLSVLGRLTTPPQTSVSQNSVVTRISPLMEPHFNTIDMSMATAWSTNSMVGTGVTGSSPFNSYLNISHGNALGNCGLAVHGRLFIGNLGDSLYTGYDRFDWSKTVVFDTLMSFAFVSGGYAAGNIFRLGLGNLTPVGFTSGLSGQDLVADRELAVAGCGMGIEMLFTSASAFDVRITTAPHGSNNNNGFTITSVVPGTPIQVTTQQAHGLTTGDQIQIRGVKGNIATAMNGIWTVTVTGTGTFTLDGSSNAAVAQQETATVVAASGITQSGTAIMTVTATGMPNSPKAISVNLTAGVHTTATAIASAMVTALNADPDYAPMFTATSSGASLITTRDVNGTYDSQLNIALANGTCLGITAAPTSTDTTRTTGGWLCYISNVVHSYTQGLVFRVVLVKSGSTVSLYFNDVLVGSTTKGVPNYFSAGAVWYSGLNRMNTGSCQVFLYRSRIAAY